MGEIVEGMTDRIEDRDRDHDRDAAPQADAESARFVERFASELTQAGMQRMASRVFAALLVSEEGAMTSAELSERLRISPAAVSGAIRYLSQVDLVGREHVPGSRRDRYVLHNHIWYESFMRRDQLLTRWGTMMRDGAQIIGPDTAAGRRVAETAEFFDFLHDELMSILDRWQAKKEAQRTAATGAE
ncbi:transcriptional regulator, trmB [Streptomyces laurentii]|uniref:Transcriptional regulator, trmB n=2 Tax=Streptomyces laurentii TaxID=39478 RepID=A0A160P0U4_STRLU|nr:transcriptional regulator, trmB [Streptomyces laurentii]